MCPTSSVSLIVRVWPDGIWRRMAPDLGWAARVWLSRCRLRLRYALRAPFVYRNWWAMGQAWLGSDVVLELRAGVRFHVRGGSGDLSVINEASMLSPYLGDHRDISVPEDGVVVDVGANIGDFSVLVARRCHKGRVIAVEPVAEYARILAQHVALNGLQNVTCVHAAIGADDGVATIAVNGARSRPRPQAEGPLEIARLTTPAQLMIEQRVDHIDLLKLDCEGAEWDILPAADDVLSSVRQIAMEYHCERGWTPDRLATWLRERGYRVWHTSGEWNGLLWAVRPAAE